MLVVTIIAAPFDASLDNASLALDSPPTKLERQDGPETQISLEACVLLSLMPTASLLV